MELPEIPEEGGSPGGTTEDGAPYAELEVQLPGALGFGRCLPWSSLWVHQCWLGLATSRWLYLVVVRDFRIVPFKEKTHQDITLHYMSASQSNRVPHVGVVLFVHGHVGRHGCWSALGG